MVAYRKVSKFGNHRLKLTAHMRNFLSARSSA